MAEVDILKDSLCDNESGLPVLFQGWNENADFTYALRFDKDDNMYIVLTDVSAQIIEVFRVDISKVV